MNANVFWSSAKFLEFDFLKIWGQKECDKGHTAFAQIPLYRACTAVFLKNF